MSMMGLIDPNLIQMLMQQGMMGVGQGGQPGFAPPGGGTPGEFMMRPGQIPPMNAAMPNPITGPAQPPSPFGPMPFQPGQGPGFGPMPQPPGQNPADLFGPMGMGKGTPMGPQILPGAPQPMPMSPGAQPMPLRPGMGAGAQPMPLTPGMGAGAKPMPLPMPQTQPPGPGFGGGLNQVQPPAQPGAPQGTMAMNPDQLAKLQAMLKKMIEEQNAGRPGGPPPMQNLTRGPLQQQGMQPGGGGAMARALEQLQQGQTNPMMARRKYYGQ